MTEVQTQTQRHEPHKVKTGQQHTNTAPDNVITTLRRQLDDAQKKTRDIEEQNKVLEKVLDLVTRGNAKQKQWWIDNAKDHLKKEGGR